MRKTIRKIGSSIGIIFNKEEAKNFNLKINVVIDLDDSVFKIKQRKNHGKKK